MKTAVHRLLHRLLGLDVVRYDGRRFIARKRIEVIEKASVTVVLDVGAGIGQFAGWLREERYTGRIVSFEPVAEEFATIERLSAADPAWTGVNVALGARNDDVVVNVAGNLQSSSLLPMTRLHETAAPVSSYVREQVVRLARLDSLNMVGPHDRAYLKIDAQGAEGAVLDGAAGTFDQIVAVELELSLRELYEGQELLPALYERMLGQGFALVWLGESMFRDPVSNEILAIDGIFLRRDLS